MKKTEKHEKFLEVLRNQHLVSSDTFYSMKINRFRSYVCELRKLGYEIETVVLDGVAHYKLVSEPKELKEVRTAYNQLAHILYKKGHKDVAENLAEILEEANVSIRFKMGTHSNNLKGE